MRSSLLVALALLASPAAAFDFDDEEDAAPASSSQPGSVADAGGAGTSVPLWHRLSTAAEATERGQLFVRSGIPGVGKTVRASQAKLSASELEAVKAAARAGGFYTISVPSVLSNPSSPRVSASVSACALLASRFQDAVQLAMGSGDRVISIAYSLPVVPASCPTDGLPRVAEGEVLFNTVATLLLPKVGPAPIGKVHDASLLPAAAAAAVHRAATAGQGGQGGEGAEPPQQQSFLRKYWMYILPVVIAMSLGGGEEAKK